jgi:hypothetical protein
LKTISESRLVSATVVVVRPPNRSATARLLTVCLLPLARRFHSRKWRVTSPMRMLQLSTSNAAAIAENDDDSDDDGMSTWKSSGNWIDVESIVSPGHGSELTHASSTSTTTEARCSTTAV